MTSEPHPRGRGATSNPSNQFKRLHYVEDSLPDSVDTRIFRDTSQSILSNNESPDVPFTYSVNPYRGCEHGCIYCYARPTHEYLGFSAGLDFESRIMVKENAPDLLKQALSCSSWEPQTVCLSGNTDPYQPVEEQLELSRDCLRVFEDFRNPVSLITKNHRITRDIDRLARLADRNLVHVRISVTTLDRTLAREMEPRTSRPGRRLQAIRELSTAGVPVGINAAPMIPGLTDHELPEILAAGAEAGAGSAAYIMVRLPGAVKELFVDWLDEKFPDRKQKVLNQIRDTRDGDLSDSEFGKRMRGEGEWADLLKQMFEKGCRQHGLNKQPVRLSTDQFRRCPQQQQLF